MRRAQTATEYLILTAVVIIIALVVIGALGGIPSIGGSASKNTQNLDLAFKNVGVSDIGFTSAGVFFRLKNNQQNTIQINNITYEGNIVGLQDQTYPLLISPGKSKLVSTYTINNDALGQMNIGYTDKQTGASYLQEMELAYSITDSHVSANLIAYWNMDANNGTHVQNLVSGEYYLMKGNTAFATGKLGNGTSHFGSADYLTDKSNLFDNDFEFTYDVTGQYSWAGWFKATNVSAYSTLISSYDTSGDDPDGYYIMVSNSRLRFGHDGGIVNTSAILASNTWTHFVATYDATDSYRTTLYIDNVLYANTTTGIMGSHGTDSETQIGYREDGNGFNGTIDEIMMWDTVLAPDQVTALYEIGR